MYAVIDIGSNTIRLVLYKIENNQIKSLLNKKSPAGLAGYINKDRCLKKSGIRKAVAVLSEFKEILDHMTIQEVFPFATASLRNINNAPEVLEAIRENCGFEVRILSGEEEAIFDYYGALQAMEMDKGLLTDIGGGSTEIVRLENGKIVCKKSPHCEKIRITADSERSAQKITGITASESGHFRPVRHWRFCPCGNADGAGCFQKEEGTAPPLLRSCLSESHFGQCM